MSNDRNGPAAQPPRAAPKNDRLFGLDKRFLAPILITIILAVGEYGYGFLESYWNTGLAIVASIALELLLARLMTGRWPHLASAYITGISVGIIVRSVLLWPYIVCSLLAITSKYALRVKGRHLWNPSNLGVSVLLFLAPTTVVALSQQWGNDSWVLLIIFGLGSAILFSLGRLHITLTYIIAFSWLSWVRSTLTGQPWISEIAVLTQPAYQLFIFFMITDPKTTTRTKTRQCVVAVLVALVETQLRLAEEIHAPYYALFIVAPVTNLLEIVWDARHPRKVSPTTTAAPPVGDNAAVRDTAPVAGPHAT